ncbi:alpha/beta fold hydrolase [Sphingomicrobium clamense]|uniref:Alpha/beta hydrolase n=1 Tax=Sphingomicrobium clamense TaxID=2851013 RepID=A0ABS6V659_9SPHN|nr:alpha/beta hydrolase [Sphingomicrobium sp. B8]MBW0145050.1 alpha/beta hydrolase [Sphingomicrobium sp. B8]
MSPALKRFSARAKRLSFGEHEIAHWDEGDGDPLLLIHGFPTSSWDWHAIWDTLTAQRRVIACDMLGFGLSDKPDARYSLFRQADLQINLLDHLGIERFDALVHDYGVSVGQELLARQAEGQAPQGIGRMIFLNGGIFPGLHRPRLIQHLGASPIGFIISRLLGYGQFRKSCPPVFGPDTQPSEDELQDYWAMIAHKDGHRRFHQLLRYMHERTAHKDRWVGALKDVQGRIGHINGALDPISGRHVYDHWIDALPNAKAHLLEDVGHYPQVEAPDRVASTVLEWLA